MLPQAGGRAWFSKYDAFATVPKDLAEATVAGAATTVVAVVICLTLIIFETSAFLTAKPVTQILVDSNQDSLLRINFDVTMLDLSCDYVTVGVWDAFGTDRMNISHNVQKQRIDHKGARKGTPYTEDEIVELEFSGQSFTEEERAELDSDWSSTGDKFKHSDFEAVLDAHDFTIVNFYADWCGHCMQFKPAWIQFEDKVNKKEMEILDADGVNANVRAIKINCVDFAETCQDQRITGFPTVRLYKRSAGGQGKNRPWQEYQGARVVDDIAVFLQQEVKSRHLHMGAAYHNLFQEGCRMSGHLEVARVPGTVHFQAMNSKDKTLNLAFTNVSHTVHHFSFGEAPRRMIYALPGQYKRHVNPLDGRTFTVGKFHQAPNHFIKVVHTRFESGLRSYQQTHQWSVRMLQRKTVPQAKFSYDLSPVEVLVTKGDRRWYDFVTQLFAITGGAFTVLSMTLGAGQAAHSHVKAAIGKLS